MTNSQIFAVLLIVVGLLGLWLESQCKFGAFLHAIYDGASFVEFVIALLLFLAALSVIGEPYSTWVAALTILVMLIIDSKRNGRNNIWKQVGL